MKRVKLHDIEDVEAFVIMCVKRSGSNAPVDQWDDLIAEGIVLLYTMARNYKSQLDGYEQAGRFSGYAIKWLPKQIKQSWHKSQEHHLYVKDQETGKRGWTYRIMPVSYEMSILSAKQSDSESGNESPNQQEVRMRYINDFIDVPTMKYPQKG